MVWSLPRGGPGDRVGDDEDEKKGLELETWVQVWPLQLTSWVTLGKTTSEPQIPHLYVEMMIIKLLPWRVMVQSKVDIHGNRPAVVISDESSPCVVLCVY